MSKERNNKYCPGCTLPIIDGVDKFEREEDGRRAHVKCATKNMRARLEARRDEILKELEEIKLILEGQS